MEYLEVKTGIKDANIMEAIKDFFSSLMLRELFKGLALTGR